MSQPNIVFSEAEKLKFMRMAEELENALEIERKSVKELSAFIQYRPLVEAIQRAKEKKINSPYELPNMNYWYFESDLGAWFHFSKSKARYALSDFMRAISGFPYEEPSGDSQQTPN
ncbi:MAG: hypothetical protein QG616_227 [Pseudomonadota bacterium]|nr:hypothetical protein [Betaproteobacteria bacterium]MDQ5880397.1 hypothetical protein [Pseudomonadota bacterium]MDQ5917973.1 hypothetical protein [Pseudomonadota bacterium]